MQRALIIDFDKATGIVKCFDREKQAVLRVKLEVNEGILKGIFIHFKASPIPDVNGIIHLKRHDFELNEPVREDCVRKLRDGSFVIRSWVGFSDNPKHLTYKRKIGFTDWYGLVDCSQFQIQSSGVFTADIEINDFNLVGHANCIFKVSRQPFPRIRDDNVEFLEKMNSYEDQWIMDHISTTKLKRGQRISFCDYQYENDTYFPVAKAETIKVETDQSIRFENDELIFCSWAALSSEVKPPLDQSDPAYSADLGAVNVSEAARKKMQRNIVYQVEILTSLAHEESKNPIFTIIDVGEAVPLEKCGDFLATLFEFGEKHHLEKSLEKSPSGSENSLSNSQAESTDSTEIVSAIKHQDSKNRRSNEENDPFESKCEPIANNSPDFKRGSMIKSSYESENSATRGKIVDEEKPDKNQVFKSIENKTQNYSKHSYSSFKHSSNSGSVALKQSEPQKLKFGTMEKKAEIENCVLILRVAQNHVIGYETSQLKLMKIKTDGLDMKKQCEDTALPVFVAISALQNKSDQSQIEDMIKYMEDYEGRWFEIDKHRKGIVTKIGYDSRSRSYGEVLTRLGPARFPSQPKVNSSGENVEVGHWVSIKLERKQNHLVVKLVQKILPVDETDATQLLPTKNNRGEYLVEGNITLAASKVFEDFFIFEHVLFGSVHGKKREFDNILGETIRARFVYRREPIILPPDNTELYWSVETMNTQLPSKSDGLCSYSNSHENQSQKYQPEHGSVVSYKYENDWHDRRSEFQPFQKFENGFEKRSQNEYERNDYSVNLFRGQDRSQPSSSSPHQTVYQWHDTRQVDSEMDFASTNGSQTYMAQSSTALVTGRHKNMMIVYLSDAKKAAVMNWKKFPIDPEVGPLTVGSLLICEYVPIDLSDTTLNAPFQVTKIINRDVRRKNEVKKFDDRCYSLYELDLSHVHPRFSSFTERSGRYVVYSKCVGDVILDYEIRDQHNNLVNAQDMMRRMEKTEHSKNMVGWCQYTRMLVPRAMIDGHYTGEQDVEAYAWKVVQVVSSKAHYLQAQREKKSENLGDYMKEIEEEDDIHRQKKQAQLDFQARQSNASGPSSVLNHNDYQYRNNSSIGGYDTPRGSENNMRALSPQSFHSAQVQPYRGQSSSTHYVQNGQGSSSDFRYNHFVNDNDSFGKRDATTFELKGVRRQMDHLCSLIEKFTSNADLKSKMKIHSPDDLNDLEDAIKMCKEASAFSMEDTINVKKGNNKLEESSSVQKLLASLQQAQNKGGVGSTCEQPSTSQPKKVDKRKKNADDKKKAKGASVGARMQQQAEIAKVLNKRTRQASTSKGGARNQGAQEYTQQPFCYNQSRGPKIPADVLDELEFRFISNMVLHEINDDIRVCFHLELAHWYYIDHMVEDTEKYIGCPNVGSRDFTIQMCQHCRLLKKYAHRTDEVIAKFREYKSSVPTYGAILVDPEMEHVLLVQSYFAKGNNWGFPKGKINQNEPPRDAAIRETFEETGFDFGIHSEREKKFQRFINEGMVRLYLVKNVPRDFNFAPQTRKEIRKIEWFKIDDLPTDKTDELPSYLQGFKFFMVMPFVRDIQLFIQKEREKMKKRKPERANAVVPTVPVTPVRGQAALEPSSVAGSSNAPSQQSILSQLFPATVQSTPNTQENRPVYKRLTSEELFSAFKKPTVKESEDNISRPKLPEMTPLVNGMDSLTLIGLCTPLKAGDSLNNFSAPSETCPMISEEVENKSMVAFNELESEVGFAMPTDLKQPVVTTDHPWQHKSLENSAPPRTLESHQGWLDTQLVNTIMHSPHPPIPSTNSPATPTNVLGHLIGKPIQPQPILPQAATPTALGSAEKPKSSRINLSDNSAFTAINSSQIQSVPKSTAPPSSEKVRSASLSGPAHVENRKSARVLFNSVASPVSTDLQVLLGEEMFEDVWFREKLAATAETSISSLAASNQELSMINRETPVEDRNPYMKQMYATAPHQSKQNLIDLCQSWTQKIQLDTEYIAGPLSFWKRQFSLQNKTPK
ncbi:CBN-DCAP-2 protein [Caenorhabditis brenneri]|uniref:mRNA-decapping enzyme 2 n=1 Tax=Caenorhabditis brenneri TaxID=135651 RepID=G0NTI7_CAEBE|nr:CBN-DCAP-2 protein [Caenorhabditis brenneri]